MQKGSIQIHPRSVPSHLYPSQTDTPTSKKFASWYVSVVQEIDDYESSSLAGYSSAHASMESAIQEFAATATYSIPDAVTDPSQVRIYNSVPSWFTALPTAVQKAKIDESDELLGGVAELIKEADDEVTRTTSADMVTMTTYPMLTDAMTADFASGLRMRAISGAKEQTAETTGVVYDHPCSQLTHALDKKDVNSTGNANVPRVGFVAGLLAAAGAGVVLW